MDRLYFDTSVINCLLDDPNCSALTNELLENFEIFFSVFNIAEIAKTSNHSRRRDLIKFSHRLLKGYRPYEMPHELLVRSLQAFINRDSEINCCIGEDKNRIWKLLCEAPLESNTYKILIQLKGYSEKWYRDMHDGGRGKLQEVIQNMSLNEQNRITSSFSSFIQEMCNNRKDIILYFIKSYIQHNIKDIEIKTDSEVQQIIDNLESWRFFLVGMGHGIYKQSIKKNNYSKKKNPGSIDTQQAIYLSICDTFVTNDKEQYKMLKLISHFGRRHKRVFKYKDIIKFL